MTSQIDRELDEQQKIFIRKKVRQLGSISAVESTYVGNCLVNEYARHIAYEIYSNHNHSNINYPAQTMPAKVQTKNEYKSYWGQSNEIKKEASNKESSQKIERSFQLSGEKSSSEINVHQVPRSTKNKLDQEAYLAALERKKERDRQSGGIPEYEEGTQRAEWGTREDHRKMRAHDWGDMQKRRKE